MSTFVAFFTMTFATLFLIALAVALCKGVAKLWNWAERRIFDHPSDTY